MDTWDWIGLAAVTIGIAGAIYCYFGWKSSGNGRIACLGMLTGLATAGLVILINEGQVTIDSLVGSVFAGGAAFGGAWFAYRLQQQSQRNDQLKQFRTNALQELYGMWQPGGPFEVRTAWSFKKRTKGQRFEIDRLHQRINLDDIRFAYYQMDEIASQLDAYSDVKSRQAAADRIGRILQQFDDVRDLYLRLIESEFLMDNGLVSRDDWLEYQTMKREQRLARASKESPPAAP